MKPRAAKVGTQPWIIVLRKGAQPVVGRAIRFRRDDSVGQWQSGLVTKINDDGFLFITL